MKFDVYCDESRPDLLSAQKSRDRYMVIGSLWLESKNREPYKEAIHDLRNKYNIGGEFKWQKVSPSRIDFYLGLIRWFIEQNQNLRFRCIVVERQKVNLVRYHQNDQELGFYKFYYQMLHHWILDFNEYSIFCDYKKNRDQKRLSALKQCLDFSNLSSRIINVQSVRSEESVYIQLTDVLTGLVGAKFNNSVETGSSKGICIDEIERLLKKGIAHTLRSEQKVNVFLINLNGGW